VSSCLQSNSFDRVAVQWTTKHASTHIHAERRIAEQIMCRTWFALALVVFGSIAAAQNGNHEPAEGRLTVSATVVGSSEIVLGPNGERRVIVANAPAAEIASLTVMLATDLPNPSLTSLAQWVWPEKSLHQEKNSLLRSVITPIPHLRPPCLFNPGALNASPYASSCKDLQILMCNPLHVTTVIYPCS